jgi:16S rRNA (cytosine967-C5)-methyltransferase
MSQYHSYLNSAVRIIDQYKGDEPFAVFLKKFFAQHKKYGSKDRKQISHLCYCFFRLGKSFFQTPVEERTLLGLFLCSTEPSEILAALKPEWNEKVKQFINEKYSTLSIQQSIFNVFPWKEELSNGIDYKKFCESFSIQPDLFIRLRPGREQAVKQKLQQTGIEFKIISDTCLALPNSSGIDKFIELDKEAVVQDYNSQRIGEFLKPETRNQKPELLSVWDSCAGSGGKSLLLYDINLRIDLTVSDKRNSIISNLRKRFEKAGIKKYKSRVTDLTSNQQSIKDKYDLIIADVPCTGSGTWSRTPEQLYYFNEGKIAEYASLQKKIVSNIISHLRNGGNLLYITCSVFKKENEEIVDYIKQKFHLKIIKMELLKGYDKKADTMFAALLGLP